MENKIKEIRQLKGMTAAKLAELCGTSTVQIFRLESGERELSLNWLNKISDALNVKPYELLVDKKWSPDNKLSIGSISNSNIDSSAIVQHGDATIIKSGSEALKPEQGQPLTDYQKDVLEEFDKLDRKKQIALIYKLQNNEINWE